MKRAVSMLLSIWFVLALVCISGYAYAAVMPMSAAAREERVYAADIMPMGGEMHETITERIDYTYRDASDYYANPYRVPAYFASGLNNSCAITAGGAIIGHFDRLYEELIPNHTGIIFMGQYVYGGQDEAVNAMHRELYTRMGTEAGGTSVEGYVSGMKSYVSARNRTASVTKAFGSSLDMSACIEALESGKLLTLFLNGFAIVSFGGLEEYDGYDEVMNITVRGRHTVTAYGYKIIKYYNSANRLIQEDSYLYVHTGFTSAGLGYIRLSKYATIEDAYIIDIT